MDVPADQERVVFSMGDRRAEPRERRIDQGSAEHVEQAVELQRTDGDTMACAFLEARRFSEHIILRVLACAAFRRKRSP